MNFTSTECDPRPLSVERSSQCHAVHVSWTVSSPADSRMAKVSSDRANAPPIAVSAIRRTASLPRRFPNTPLTNAPSAGSARIAATRRKSFAGKSSARACMVSS